MKRAEPGWFVLALAGLAAVLGSFLPFYTFAGDVYATVWSRGLFPTAALIPLLGFAIGVEALFVLIRGHEPRSPFLNLTWEQVRLAVGAFMILLALSYIVQDRAGGTLGLGYLALSISALATFAGGVMTRRAELARAPGEEQPVRESRPVFGPAIATVNRVGTEFGKNVAGFGHNVRARLEERSKARAEAKAAAAAAAAAAAKAKAEAEQRADIAARDAVVPVDTPEAPAMQPPPPTETFDVPAAELPTAAKNADVAPAEARTAVEDIEEPTVEEVAKAVTEPAGEEVQTPGEELTAEQPVAPADDMLVEEPAVDEPATKVSEEPAGKDAEEEEEEAAKPTRVAPLSAVASETDPDETPTVDGKTPQPDDSEKTVESKRTDPPPAEAGDGETEKESADTGTES
jgi:hypothetical protein